MRRRALFAALLLLPALAFADDDRAWFGIALNAKGDGIFPFLTIETLTIGSVTPGSPAERGGLHAGDRLLEIGGVPVAGKKARSLAPLLRRRVGETLTLRLQRPGGETYTAELTGAPRPD